LVNIKRLRKTINIPGIGKKKTIAPPLSNNVIVFILYRHGSINVKPLDFPRAVLCLI